MVDGSVLNVFDACVEQKNYSFQFFFFIDISVKEHAHFLYSFVLLFIWIITDYFLKLFCSATVPLSDTIVLSWACHVRLTFIDVSK